MLALKATPPSFNAAEGERIARDLFGLAVKADRLHGERDCNFKLSAADGRQYLLKLFDSAHDAGNSDCLAQVLRHLEEQDASLPVSKLLPALDGATLSRMVRDGASYEVALLSYLPGTLLRDAASFTAYLRELGALLARVDRALQGFFHPSLSRSLAWDMRRLPELLAHAPLIASKPLRGAVEAIAQNIRARLPKLRALKSQPLHADCHGSNVLIDGAGRVSGLLDFGDMLHGPTVFEPAIGMAEFLMEGATLSEAAVLLSGYAGRERLGCEDLEALTDLILARQACSVLLHAYRCAHDPDGAKLLAGTAQRTAESLLSLHAMAPAASMKLWLEAAGQLGSSAGRVNLQRRHALLGAGAELFYRAPLELVRGEGVWLYDPDGVPYLDVYNNVPHVGHAHPTVVRAIQEQVAVLATHTRYLHDGILRYAEELTAGLPKHLNACIFVNSGSEANDVAWRMAKMATGGSGALIMSHAYHGITDAIGALTPGSATPQEPWVATLAAPALSWQWGEPLPEGAAALILKDAQGALEQLAERGERCAAFYLDSGITSTGIFDPPHAWAEIVSERVRAAGGLIVADEVQYGLGRSGSHFWSFERRGLRPDIVTLGKPVGNGFPMGVIVANRDLIEEFQRKYGFFSTFGGNAVAAAAGLAVLSVLKREGLQQNALHTGEYLRAGLSGLAKRHGVLGAVRGHGLLLGLEVKGGDAPEAKRRTGDIVNELASAHRVLIGSEGPNSSILKLRPPMPFYREHADLLLQAIDAAAGRMA